ncbi:TetR/AcrR family transcriptional regulator [Kerstersia gyiorum]|uniref:TetR/AcrR family transcriptional regulator n=1 Tax=Kerstersia gyiorum TaxID=206506 RepID=UPI000A754761|nr:TetR/AcrR family transcriptional regulator [Kerstersia gyiorum]MCP1633209.1 AcrR family transcriptional regulator [Kerstersia gyiorum]MCP1637068.1 AcrR family transcriptional regulator [Kerstersia gyiorum]MCP1672684.1 AcrR family transcriptional regulator [Kerstersia gyiorum]MCP1679527.1 AcrR family transcriptional regulator [Kerstersia gyiorum]MCP1682728.1 AcrR family transcriptional regulator [Kerstersia gyiorum]
MQVPEQPATRGRPRTITRERIADAGIEIGLPNITFVGVAAAMGVSHMALYKHVPSLEELKRLVAEEVFSRWQIPVPRDDNRDGLNEYLTVFSASVRGFVKAHPGVTPYVIRRLAATPPMLAKIDGHQRHIAEVYGITKEQARWLLATVAFHSLAASDTVYSVAGREPAVETERAAEEAEMEAELDQGIQALIVGALAMLEDAAWQSGLTCFLDTSALPIARMREFPASTTQINQWLADMEALMQAKQDFVLVYERLPAPDEPGDPDGRKKTVLWLKAHREAFKTYCRGMVLMCEDASALPALQDMLAPLEKVYRVPARVACTDVEAQAHVKDLTAAQASETTMR